jgi:biopolymer transport protein ExbD
MVIIVVLATLTIAGLVVLGGAAWFFLSFRDARMNEETARAEAMRAQMEAVRARIASQQEFETANASLPQEIRSSDEIPSIASGEVTIAVNDDASIGLDGGPASLQEALTYLAEESHHDNGVLVRILADRNCQFATVASLIEACNNHGVSYRVEVADQAAVRDSLNTVPD